MTWGDEDAGPRALRDRRNQAGERRLRAGDLVLPSSPAPPRELLAIFRDYYGPTMNAFDAASKAGRADQLEAELTALFESQNRGGDSTEVPATFLKVTAKKG